jgi:hypothetical protein
MRTATLRDDEGDPNIAHDDRPSPVGPGARFEPAPTGGGEWVHLLDEDPDLADGLGPAVFARARRLLRAPVVTLQRRSPRPPACDPSTTFGLLILDGLMGRRLRVGQAQATELLGRGDILRPWDEAELLQSRPCAWRCSTRRSRE